MLVPNTQTRAAMQEAEEIVRTRDVRFTTSDELFIELEKDNSKSANDNAKDGRLYERLPRMSCWRGFLTHLQIKQSRQDKPDCFCPNRDTRSTL